MIMITVSDNGKVINVAENIGDLVKSEKLGLTRMQERAQLVSGTLIVLSQPDEGTKITLELPG
jgi:signal transduction histidine kinase